MAPLEEITNTARKFRLHVDIEQEYATLRSARSTQMAPNDLHQLRMQGCKSIDLWTDGSLYPRDPLSGAPPIFHNTTMLLRFIGDGYNGLLGYCMRLHSLFLDEARKRIQFESLFQHVQCKYTEDVNNLNQKYTKDVKNLNQKVDDLTKQLKVQQRTSKERFNSFVRVTDNYVQLQNSTRNMRRRIDHLTHLPLGCKVRTRKRQAVELLATKGGAKKRRLRATRYFANAMMGCGIGAIPARAGLLKHVVKAKDILQMVQDSSNEKTTKLLRLHFFSELKDLVSPRQMMETCDAAGVSRRGYEAIYKLVTMAHRSRALIRPLLPTPYSVSMAKKCANLDVASMLGGFKCVQDTLPLSKTKSFQYNGFNNVYVDVQMLQRAMIKYYGLTHQECDGKVIFVLKLDECQIVKGHRLERVSLTLMNRALRARDIGEHQNEEQGHFEDEEVQVADNTGLRVQTRRKKKLGQEYYGVQSEKNIWWLAAFELPHETHDTLTWYFNQTCIPNIISQQTEGQKLHVLGIGSFEVEWHMAGDLKTLKCMLGCKLGANTMFPCIYCCHMKEDPSPKQKGSQTATTSTTVGKGKGGKGPVGKGRTKGNSKSQGMKLEGNKISATKPSSIQWFNGILSCDQTMAPNRDQEDKDWKPILNIPLSRVHVCSLHARLRILDKLLKLHVNYAWNMEPEERREESICALQDVLSSVGLHGGAVTLTKDTKISGSTQNNPSKICMGGAKARHLLSNHTDSQSHTEFEIWKKICDVTTYKGNDAALGLKRARVWESLDVMVRLLERAKLSNDELGSLKLAINRFTELMVDGWGETHITHYMHILYAHGSYFLDEYGSLALWSTQGMERSHYQAKAVYFKNTRHGGGTTKSNALHEMFNWFYRSLGGRGNSRDKICVRHRIVKVLNATRTQAYHNSRARDGLRCWLATRRRCGSRWLAQ